MLLLLDFFEINWILREHCRCLGHRPGTTWCVNGCKDASWTCKLDYWSCRGWSWLWCSTSAAINLLYFLILMLNNILISTLDSMLLRPFLHRALIWLQLHNLILIGSTLIVDIWKSCHSHVWHPEILIRLGSQIYDFILIYLLDLSESRRRLEVAFWAWFSFYLDVFSLDVLVQVV